MPYAALLITGGSGFNLVVDARQQRITRNQPERGAVVTVFDGETMWEAATNNLDPGHLEVLGEALVSRVAGSEPGKVLPRAPRIDEGAVPRDAGVPTPAKLEQAKSLLSTIIKADSRIVNGQIMSNERVEERIYIGGGGIRTSRLVRTMWGAVAMAVEDGRMQYYVEVNGACTPVMAAPPSEQQLTSVAEMAVKLLKAESITPGLYDCVVAPSIAGVLAHEAFGHGVELDMMVKTRARSAQYFGKSVGSPIVNIIDDPTISGGPGSFFMDDEGQPARKTVIVENGIYRTGLGDRYSTARLHMDGGHNGRRERYDHKAYPRMSNTFIAPGNATFEEMLAAVGNGIYLHTVQSGMEDPLGWGCQVLVHVGEEIKGGKLTGRLFNPVGLTGYVPDLLSSIDMIGSDFALDPGFCGKGFKEWVPVSSGGPHLKMKARLG